MAIDWGVTHWGVEELSLLAPVASAMVAGGLIGHLVSAVNGAAVARGASWLRDALGERVLPAGFDLVERPRLPGLEGLVGARAGVPWEVLPAPVVGVGAGVGAVVEHVGVEVVDPP